jgi:hypothetical protein
MSLPVSPDQAVYEVEVAVTQGRQLVEDAAF